MTDSRIEELRRYMRSRDTIQGRRWDEDGLPLFGEQPYAGDCGLDLVTSADAELRMGETANIPCGVAVALPPGTFGWVTARSGTWVRHGVLVVPGIIDEGWRGELRTLVYKPYLFHRQDGIPMISYLPAGTRLAQLIVLPNLLRELRVEQVSELPPADRGLHGFGSSGG